MIETKELSLEQIVPDPNQPRQDFDEEEISNLAESIRINGLLQPILVSPLKDGNYRIITGERRYRACKQLELKTINAIIIEISDDKVLEVQLVENIQRENLCPLEEARTLERMRKELGLTDDQIAHRIGKNRQYVTHKRRLLNLGIIAYEALKKGEITEGHAQVLVSKDETIQEHTLSKIKTENLSVKRTKELFLDSSDSFVRRLTSSNIPEEGMIVGVWLPPKEYNSLKIISDSRRTSIEELCSQFIVKEVNSYD